MPPATTWPTSSSACPARSTRAATRWCNLRQYVHSLYVQDDFHVTPKLTVNLGLRWEFATPLFERDNNYSNFDPTTNSHAEGQRRQPATIAAWSIPITRTSGPRIGLAYSIDPKTVVRGGYGISYTFFNRVGSALEGINAPQALFGVLNQSFPNGGPVPSDVPDHAEQLHHRHRESRRLSIRSTPTSSTFRQTANGRTSRPGSSPCSARSPRTRWSKLPTTATTACACRSSPITIRPT